MSRVRRLSMTSVRHAGVEDVPQLVHVAAGQDEVLAELGAVNDGSRPGPVVADGWLLVVGQPVVGFARVLELDDHVHVAALVVDQRVGRRGIGRMLLHAAYGLALDAGVDRITVVSPEEQPWSAPWFTREAFTPVTEVPHRRTIMARPVADEPVPTAAVSVIPVRDGSRGIEAFVQHRVSTMDFAPGVVVFPGGRVDPEDGDSTVANALPAGLVADHARAWTETDHAALGDPATAARTVIATGVREVAEETGAVIDPARLLPWDDWVTPTGYPRRFDVRFLLFPVAGAEADTFRHATTEAHTSIWMPLGDLVEACEDGQLALLPPTRTLVDELSALRSVSAALALRPRVSPVHHDISGPRPRPAGSPHR